MIQEIGSMVYQLRKKLFVTQESLSRGLLSTSELSRIERGEKDGDSFLMTALFQRLGKSMDQFEMTVSNEEYKLILLRAFIQESMESGDYGRTEELLDEYEDSMESEKLLHVQYVGMICAILGHMNGGTREKCLEDLKHAMSLTFTEEERRVDWTGYLFCIQEVQLLMLLAHFEMETGSTREAMILLEKLHDCIDLTYTSEVSKVQVYPKCCYLLAKAYLKEGRPEDAYAVAEKGIQNLVKTRFLTFIEELLTIQQECEWSEERAEQIKALHFAYELAEYRMPESFVVRLLFGGICDELTLNHELIREMRVAQGMTQEEVSYGICSRETLSRIEKGRTPNRKKLQELLQRLGIERERYSSYVVTDDWDTYELVREYKGNCLKENQEDANDILSDIEPRLDMSIIANRQFLETARVRHLIRKREISWEDGIKRLEELLRYTMPEYNGKLIRIPTREEFLILNRIALSLKLSGRREEAISLYEEILQKYQASAVKAEHHSHVMMLLYLNYLELLESSGYIEKAEKIGRKGCALALIYHRGDVLALHLANIACAFEKSETQAEDSLVLACLKTSCRLLDFFHMEKKCRAVKKYIEEIDT